MFRILALLLQRRHSPEANQTLHDVWPSPGLVLYIYIFGGSCPLMEFRHVQNLLWVLALSYIGSVTAQHSSGRVSQTLQRGTRNGITEFSEKATSYSAGRPSCWASAHILVQYVIDCMRLLHLMATSKHCVVRTTELPPPSRRLTTIEPAPPPSRCFTVFSVVFVGAVSSKLPLTVPQCSDSHLNATSFDPA